MDLEATIDLLIASGFTQEQILAVLGNTTSRSGPRRPALADLVDTVLSSALADFHDPSAMTHLAGALQHVLSTGELAPAEACRVFLRDAEFLISEELWAVRTELDRIRSRAYAITEARRVGLYIEDDNSEAMIGLLEVEYSSRVTFWMEVLGHDPFEYSSHWNPPKGASMTSLVSNAQWKKLGLKGREKISWGA